MKAIDYIDKKTIMIEFKEPQISARIQELKQLEKDIIKYSEIYAKEPSQYLNQKIDSLMAKQRVLTRLFLNYENN